MLNETVSPMLSGEAFGWGLGAWRAYAGASLMALSLGALLLLGLPMLLCPLQWAKRLGWAIPAQDADAHLAIYFGRSLGMVTCALSGVTLLVKGHPSVWPLLFNLNLIVFLAAAAVHTWGAVRRIQPLSETLEIPVWLVLAASQYLFYPALQWRWS